MQLKKFVKGITEEFCTEFASARRMRAASAIADKYRIEPPQVVLLFTLPELCTLPLSERCAKAGITEEELFLCCTQQGFRKFLVDYEGMARSGVTMQSLDKLSLAIKDNRVIPSLHGDRDDYSIEMKAIEKPSVQVNNTSNTQNNTFFERAMEQARLESEDD